MIAAYLLHAGQSASGSEAIEFFGQQRTYNGKGLTIPSQMRYVYYYDWLHVQKRSCIPRTFTMQHVRMNTVPKFGKGAGEWNVEVAMWMRDGEGSPWRMMKVYDYQEKMKGHPLVAAPGAESLHFDITHHELRLYGDVRFVFTENGKPVFRFWFNTGFVSRNYLCFSKSTLDIQKTGVIQKSEKKSAKKIDDDFKLELFLVRVKVNTPLRPAPLCPCRVHSRVCALRTKRLPSRTIWWSRLKTTTKRRTTPRPTLSRMMTSNPRTWTLGAKFAVINM
jgi:hypothetical protein